MSKVRKQISANAFYCMTPSHSWAGLWSHPQSNGTRYKDIDFWTEIAAVCEKGLLDGIFIADALGVMDVYQGSPAAMIRSGSLIPAGDPMLVVAAMAAVTKHLGFGITGNATYESPYLLARRLATLDHLTKGRLAWNVVTGVLESTSRAMGRESWLAHDERYDAADDFMDLMYKYWEGAWEDDAVLSDKQAKIYADPSKVHQVHHRGKYYRSDAWFPVEPSPQRTPFIFQAGSSGRGLRFAGRHAEAIFTGNGDLAYIAKTVRAIRESAVSFGRAPTDVKAILAATIIVAPSDAEAQNKYEDYAQYADYHGTLAHAAGYMGKDLSQLDPDAPLSSFASNASQTPVDALTTGSGKICRIKDIGTFAPMEGRDLFLVGSPTRIADAIEQYVDEADIDGLNLLRTIEPESLKAFCDLVVPELQNRGMFKTEYATGTLRQKMFGGADGRASPRHPAAQFRR